MVGLLGIVAFAVSALFYMPARVAVQNFAGQAAPSRLNGVVLTGTIWNGEAQLDANHALRWTVDRWASLLTLRAVADVQLDGPDIALTGRVTGGAGRLRVIALQGRAGWSLVQAILPDAPILCDGAAVVEALTLNIEGTLRTGEGVARTTPATCARRDGQVAGVLTPALRAMLDSDAEGMRVVVTAEGAPGTPLVTARLTNADRLILTLHRAGAAMVPGMPATADSEVELPLSALMP